MPSIDDIKSWHTLEEKIDYLFNKAYRIHQVPILTIVFVPSPLSVSYSSDHDYHYGIHRFTIVTIAFVPSPL